MEQAAAPLATPTGTLQEPARALRGPAPASPLQVFSGVTKAPASTMMGSLADDSGDVLTAFRKAFDTAWRAPVTPVV